MELIITVGMLLQFLYPKHNYRGIRQDFVLRRVQVTAVRLIDEHPLDPTTILNDPFKNRGSMLITAWDLDRNAERMFYREVMREVQELKPDPSVFKPLALAMLKDGQFVRIKELADPRAAWVERFGKLYPELGAA